MTTTTPPRGRWAPTPSGLLHVGSARTALLTWLSVRSAGGTLLWRLEDLDPPRTVEGAAEAAMEDLAWLGLDWDEGPDAGGSVGPYEQSLRGDHYEAALRHLAEAGRLFPCRRSRRDLRDLARAPHGGRHAPAGTPPPYPAAWRPRELPPGWFEAFARGEDRDAALRFKVSEEPVRFTDHLQGEVVQRVDLEVGDFVLKRRDGLYAYQLAVVVDDLAMGVTEVVRGSDLLDSTPRQIQLIRALGGELPAYVHVPLVLNAAGEKLSKSDGGLTLRSLREAGVTAPVLTGYLAWTLGLRDSLDPCRPQELAEAFSWRRLRLEDWRLPQDLAADLLA